MLLITIFVLACATPPPVSEQPADVVEIYHEKYDQGDMDAALRTFSQRWIVSQGGINRVRNYWEGTRAERVRGGKRLRVIVIRQDILGNIAEVSTEQTEFQGDIIPTCGTE